MSSVDKLHLIINFRNREYGTRHLVHGAIETPSHVVVLFRISYTFLFFPNSGSSSFHIIQTSCTIQAAYVLGAAKACNTYGLLYQYYILNMPTFWH